MTLSFSRRLTVGLMISALFVTILTGNPSRALTAARSSQPSFVNCNPICLSAFGRRACFTAVFNGIRVNLTGYPKEYNKYTGADESQFDVGIVGKYQLAHFFRIVEGQPSKAFLIPAAKEDLYTGYVSFIPPGAGNRYKAFEFTMLAPQVGMSDLRIISTDIPLAYAGHPFFFRVIVSGGVRPYKFWDLLRLPNYLTFNRTGPNAGTITGKTQARSSTSGWSVPIVVRDKAGHGAFTVLGLSIYG